LTKLPKLPATAPSGLEIAEKLVAQREDELAQLETDIASAEASLPDLAESDDEAAYEAAGLKIERLRHKELRATKRLEHARDALVEAEKADEQACRRVLFAEGQKATAEAQRLAGEYSKHATAIVDILNAIHKLEEPIEAANKSLPEGERRIEAHALRIEASVKLPAATEDGEDFWWHDFYGRSPLNPPPPRSPGSVLVDGACVMFDPANPAHVAARDAKPSTPQPVAQREVPTPPRYGERTLPDGSRKFVMPPCEFGKTEPQPEKPADGRKGFVDYAPRSISVQ
jgi:hypothetical protein